MFKETHSRSIAKTLSWRLWATLTTIALVFAFTGQAGIAFTIGGLEVILKMLLYFVHERAWDRIRFGKQEIQPMVLWFTGLSGSGKSTISKQVYAKLNDLGLKVEHLDGDSIRHIFPSTGFTREARDEHIKRVGHLASRLEQHGVFVIASFVSPYREARDFVRSLCRNFVEIHVSTPLEECERRDVKGLYARARKGEIHNFTGIDDPYEPPENPELRINTVNVSVDEAVQSVMDYVKKAINHG